jgi:hypothetical protein
MTMADELDGPITAAVRADLVGMESEGATAGALSAIAVKLAQALDSHDPSSGATVIARTATELRSTLRAIVRGEDREESADGDKWQEFTDRMSAAIRDTPDTWQRNLRDSSR